MAPQPRIVAPMQLSDRVAPMVDLVFPPRCPLCGAAVARHGGLCADCWGSLVIPGEPACRGCGRPFVVSPGQDAVCAACLASPPRHDGLVAATLYNAAARQLVLAFKRGGRIALAPLLGRMMAARLATGPVPGIGAGWLIVPVPLHRWRLWTRGYNQSALLGREIARRLGAGVLVDALVRQRATPSLGGLGRRARSRVLRGAIGVTAAGRRALFGARVVLVDDVLTSGSTTEACVRALRRAGARTIVVCCFARVLDEALPDSGVAQPASAADI